MLVNIIVAICENFGIGLDNKIPWHLPSELKHFRKMTMTCQNAAMQNAVIMGRKTYESIPQQFRPLKRRVNVVLTREKGSINKTEGVVVARSLHNAFQLLRSPPLGGTIETAWICGGSSVYEEVLKRGCWNRLYITSVHEAYKCDAFFPVINYAALRKVSDELVSSGMQEEGGIVYHVDVYENNNPVFDDQLLVDDDIENRS
uniref:dihydrofolate reductase n=1 Tax=Trichuris muris TaxID=70415 RepID=A0A5S6Q9D4_TRIMR